MKHELYIENLKCGGCASTILKELSKIDNIEQIEVDIEKSKVVFTSENEKLSQVKEKLNKLGYPIVGNDNTLIHKAKSYVSCAVGKVSK